MNEEINRVVEDSELDDNLKSLLKYRLLLAELSEDDIFTNILMLRKLKQTYDKYKIPIPQKIKDYIIYQTLRIHEEIELMKKENRSI